jgi:hypothetical protein
MSRTKPSKPSNDRQLFLISLAVFLGTCVLVFAVLSSGIRPGAPLPTSTPAQRITLEPQVIANLTALPADLGLSGDLYTQLDEVERLMNACPAYVQARRLQMQQHIAWLRNPDAIPDDLLVAFGNNPIASLIFGMATYTTAQWSLENRHPTSCLVPIGRLLNQMLLAIGETPFEEFGG